MYGKPDEQKGRRNQHREPRKETLCGIRAQGRRLSEKLEIHHTPKHGSWLNMAEIELSVLSRQCLDRRVPDFETLEAEAAVWQERRDAAGVKIDWRFRTEDARIKLRRLYPSLQKYR